MKSTGSIYLKNQKLDKFIDIKICFSAFEKDHGKPLYA